MFNFNNKYFYFSVNYLSSPHHRYNNLFILRYKNFFFYNLSLINYSINISLKFIQAISRGNGVLYILHAMQSLAGIRHLRILRTAYLYSTIGTRKGLISNYKNQMKLRIYRNIKKKHLMTVPPAAVLFLNPSDNFYEIKQMRNYQIVSLGISSAEFGAGNIFNYNIYGSLKLKEFSNNLFTTLFLLHVFLGYKERYLNIYTKFFTKFSSLRNSKLLRRYRAYSYLGIRTFNFRRRQAVKAEQRKRRKAQRGGERAIRKKVRWMRNPRNRGKTFITREKKDKFWLRSPFYIVRKERLPSRYKVRKLLYPQMAKMRKRRRNRFVMEIVKRRRLRLVDIRRRIWRFYWGRFIKKRLKRQSFSKKRDRKFFRKYNLNIIRPRRNVRKVARWVKKRRFRFLKSNEYKRYYTNKIHRFSERVRGNLLLKKKLYNTFIRTVSYRLTRRSKRHLFNKRYRHLHRKLYIYGAVHLLQQNRLIPRFKHKYPYTNYYRFRKVDLDDRKLLDQRLTYSKYFPIKGVKAATNKKSSRVFSRNFYGYVTNYLKKKKI